MKQARTCRHPFIRKSCEVKISWADRRGGEVLYNSDMLSPCGSLGPARAGGRSVGSRVGPCLGLMLLMNCPGMDNASGYKPPPAEARQE